MNRLNISIFLLGCLNASAWLWVPVLARWQARNMLERYDSLDTLESMMDALQEEMLSTYIASGAIGVLMLVAFALIYNHRVSGWHLWTACLVVSLCGAFVSILSYGVTTGAILRIFLFAAFAYVSIRIYRGPTWFPWFHHVPGPLK